MNKLYLLISLFILSLTFPNQTFSKGGDKPGPASSAQILEGLEKLNVLGSVLYIAAHPDDENTRLISWLANDVKVRTGYLSLTRGDGGQNLIGTEKGELIGVLRTQELMEARKIDGGVQFFSRAVDFGYSKTTKETLEKWNEEQVLWDMVWVIRKFKPEVIITRFPPTQYAGHGHHSASAVLTEKAIEMAADVKVFPEQLKKVTAWRVNRLYHNTSTWWNKDLPERYKFDRDLIRVDVGTYNANLGKWNNQIAMESRSQHKSQGFGASILRGEQFEYLKYMSGEKGDKSIFDGIDLTWRKMAKSGQIQNQINTILDNFEPREPSAIVDDLLELYRLLENYPYVSPWIDIKKNEVQQLIFDAAGLWMEAVSEQEYVIPGGEIEINTSIINAGNLSSMTIDSVSFPGKDTAIFGILDKNVWQKVSVKTTVPTTAQITQPYWLRKDYKNMFFVDDVDLRGMPETPSELNVTFHIHFGPQSFDYTIPISYKWRDRVSGENIKRLSVRPDATVNIDNSVYVCPNGNTEQIHVTVVAQKGSVTGTLNLELPDGWKASPKSHTVTLNTAGSATVFTFEVQPEEGAKSGQFEVYLQTGNKKLDRSIVNIEYPHIHTQTLFPKCRGKIVTGDIQLKSKNIGYIMGAGDNVPEAITQLGGNVEFIVPSELPSLNLSRYDVIVAGIRAYNTQKDLAKFNGLLLNYVDSGGLLVVQYNTYGKVLDQIGPYKMDRPSTRRNNRITNEFATTRILDAEHPIMTTPNAIGIEDFDNWVQERGLYFPGSWDSKYTPLLRWADPEEEPLDGALLVADYGKGKVVYTGISFFRQLPAGVPGAFKLWANILSYGR